MAVQSLAYIISSDSINNRQPLGRIGSDEGVAVNYMQDAN